MFLWAFSPPQPAELFPVLCFKAGVCVIHSKWHMCAFSCFRLFSGRSVAQASPWSLPLNSVSPPRERSCPYTLGDGFGCPHDVIVRSPSTFYIHPLLHCIQRGEYLYLFFFNFIFHSQIRILGNWQIVFVYVFVPLCSEVGGLFKIGLLPWSCQFQDQDWHLAVKKTKPYLEKDVAHPHSLATQDWPQGMENLHPGCLGWVESLACILKGEIFRKVIEAKH